MVQLPGSRHREAVEQQLRGPGCVRLVCKRLPVQQRVERCTRADPTAAQLRRRSVAHEHDPRCTRPELWGSNATTAAYNFDHYFAKGRAPLWNDLGNGNWASAPNSAIVVLRVYNEMLTSSGQPGQCPADGLLFGALTEVGPCPVGLRQPGRAVAANSRGGYYVLNGDGTVLAYNGAPSLGSPNFDWDLARDITMMPDDDGYVVLLADGTVSKWGTATSGALANLGSPSLPDDARAIAVMPDGAGYVVLDGMGTVYEYGSATTGLVGSGTTLHFDLDVARDIVIVSSSGTISGYFVADAWGGVWSTQQLPAYRNPRAQLFADRWRPVTVIGGKPFMVRNDGTTAVAGVPG